MPIEVVLASGHFSNRAQVWAYLGKDTIKRGTLALNFRDGSRLQLGSRLNRIARATRADVIKRIAAMGQLQDNQLTWWASRLASRSPYQTDIHLLVSLALLFQELVEEHGIAQKGHILLIIEDIWLYQLLREDYRHNGAVKFSSAIGWILFLKKAQCTARGLAARFWLLARILRQMASVTITLQDTRLAESKSEDESITWIYSYAEPRLFQGRNHIDDPYLLGLYEMLRKHGVSVRGLIGLIIPPSCEKRLSVASEAVPLLAGLDLKGLWAAFTQHFTVKGSALFEICGINMHRLIEREMWEEVRHSNLVETILYYYAFLRFFESHRGECLFFLYEGQPWEKMLFLAKRTSGATMKLVGYQHSTIPVLLLNYFPHPREWDYLPRPDCVLANGPLQKSIMEDAGYPKGILEEGGALRYQQFERRRAIPRSKSDRATKPSIIFVALPADPFIARDLMDRLVQHSDAWSSQGVYFWIKPHPDCPLEWIGWYPEREEYYETVTRTLSEIVGEIDAVLYSSTTVGLEALLFGVPALAYIPEMAICCDPVLDWFAECIITCDCEDFRETILGCVHGRINPRRDAPNAKLIFGKVEESVWVAVAGK